MTNAVIGSGGRSDVVLLVRFGELALKSRFVRRQLRDRLVANIQDLFAAEGVECITEADEARVYVHVDDIARARGILARVFGVVSVSPALETKATLESLREGVLGEAALSLGSGQTFALRTRRVGTHPFTSQDLARILGDDVRRSVPGSRVNLNRPDVEIHIEVRRNRGWMGMKRGCHVTIAAPEDGSFVGPLRRWDVRLKVLDLPTTDGLADLVRIARADALFLGTRWSSFEPGGRPPLPVPVFEPVIGLSQDEIDGLATRIRTA
ncbi:MAG: hypothetical protein E6K14_01080 [Methanobacteriota archaeon]|nr:MAG: hypothetical protein E6K14_01080 [Euryarchaeota archaeon]